MKRLFSLLFAVCILSISFAQTQKGIVKTRGRMVNGKVEPGKRLSGTTITLNFGNALVSNGQGLFSFNVPAGKSYALMAATKQGYMLADPEYTKRSFAYSAKNPFYVVMEDANQLQADIKEATDKVRRSLKRELRKREDELDELRESNAITQSKYDSLRVEFANYRQNSENLVREMAERYASTDYDQLDDFNRQVQMYIEDGELQKADSMIRSKGTFDERIARIQQFDKTNSLREEEIQHEQEELDKSKELAAREKADLAQDLYNQSLIFLQQYQWDEALGCLRLRTELDANNLEYADDYAYLCQKQHHFEEAIKYYKHVAALLESEGREDLYILKMTNVSEIYRFNVKYKEQFDLLSDLLLRSEQLDSSDPEISRIKSNIYLNLGSYYQLQNQYAKSAECLQKGYEHLCYYINQSANQNESETIRMLIQIGASYGNMFHDQEALHYLKMALEKHEDYVHRCPQVEIRDLKANIHSAMASAYNHLEDYVQSIKEYTLAEEVLRQLAKINPEAYDIHLADLCWNKGTAYFYIGEKEKAIEYTKESVRLFEENMKRNPSLDIKNYNIALNNLGYINFINGNLDEAADAYLKSQAILNPLYEKYPNSFAYDYALLQINLFGVYRAMGELEKCSKMKAETESLADAQYSRLQDVFQTSIIIMYKEFVHYHKLIGEIEAAIKYIDKIQSISPNDPDLHALKQDVGL